MRPKTVPKLGKWLLDAVAVAIAVPTAYLIRFEGSLPPDYRTQLYTLLGFVVAGRLATNFVFGLGKQKWVFLETRDMIRIAASYATFSGLLLLIRFSGHRQQLLMIPVGVIAAELLLSLLFAWGLRLLRRRIFEYAQTLKGVPSSIERLLLVGANAHGVTIGREMAMRKGIKLVGFLDGDPKNNKMTFGGIPVLGNLSLLSEMVRREQVTDVLICLAPSERDGLNLNLGSSNVRTRIAPTMEEILDSEDGGGYSSRNSGATRARLGRRALPMSLGPLESRLSGKRILITGGAGFVGSNLAERLASKNELILFDTAFANKPIQFTKLCRHPNVKLVVGNILDDTCLPEVCRDVDMVVHAAAVVGVGKVCSAARETLETNYIGTSRVLRALEANSRLARFIYLSTSEVFGVNSYRVDEATPPMMGPIAEARWSYSMAKLAGEHLVQSYFREAKMPTVIVRPFNIFGPRRTGDYVLLRFIVNAIANKPLQVHGDGSQIRSWCFINDFCDALIAMLERPQAVGEDFNIGNPGNTLTVKELAQRVIDIVGSSSTVEFIENPFPDIQIRVPSLEKAHGLLAYKPRYDLDTALALTIDWYRENWDFFLKMVLPDYGVNHKVATAVTAAPRALAAPA
jgi:dTDP-glucose 4,6-dehydratase